MTCTFLHCLLLFSQGLRIARLRVIFKIPEHFHAKTFGSGAAPPEHLAYVEWFTKPRQPDRNHGMYPVSYSTSGRSGDREFGIIDASSIVRSCQLIPKFGKKVNRSWTSCTVLDDCSHFFVNNWKDDLTYQTIY